MPYNFICVQAGCFLSQLTSIENLFTFWTLLKLLGIANIALLPGILIKHYHTQRVQAKEQAKKKLWDAAHFRIIIYLCSSGNIAIVNTIYTQNGFDIIDKLVKYCIHKCWKKSWPKYILCTCMIWAEFFHSYCIQRRWTFMPHSSKWTLNSEQWSKCRIPSRTTFITATNANYGIICNAICCMWNFIY